MKDSTRTVNPQLETTPTEGHLSKKDQKANTRYKTNSEK